MQESPISIPGWLWAVIAGAVTALTGAITYLFKYIIARHKEEIAGRDERRREDSAAWKEAITTVAASNEKAMAQLGATIGQHIKESTQQQTKVVEALGRQLKQPVPRKTK